jgi:hypothetical protein
MTDKEFNLKTEYESLKNKHPSLPNFESLDKEAEISVSIENVRF